MTDTQVSVDPAHRLQEGIYFDRGQRLGACFLLLLLNVLPGVSVPDARAALTAVWSMLDALRSGVVRDLRATRPGDVEVRVPGGDLTCLLGIGARLFDERAHIPRLADRARRPWSLTPLRMGPDAPFPSLPCSRHSGCGRARQTSRCS